jgi:GntR family transcriptional regulator
MLEEFFFMIKEKGPFQPLKTKRKISRKSLYLEIIDFLVEDIRTGKYPPGSKLPSEGELAHDFSVSRVTLREALRVLEEDGVIIRRHGIGTFVRDRKIMPIQKLSKILSASMMFKKAGLEDHFAKINYNKIPATRKIAEKLQIPLGSEVWEVERLRTIGKQPAIYSLDYFPASIIPRGGEEKLKNHTHSLYKFLAEVCGQVPEQGQCILKPITGDENLSAIMKAPRTTSLMYIESVDLNQNQQPIICAREYYLADLFEFQVERKDFDSES